MKIHLDSAESSGVEQKEMRETNSLVEEFSVLVVNIGVARKIWETLPMTTVLR